MSRVALCGGEDIVVLGPCGHQPHEFAVWPSWGTRRAVLDKEQGRILWLVVRRRHHDKKSSERSVCTSGNGEQVGVVAANGKWWAEEEVVRVLMFSSYKRECSEAGAYVSDSQANRWSDLM